MGTKLNIVEILKDKPKGTKLYSPLFGDVYLSSVKDSIINVEHHKGITKFFDNGRYYNYPESEPVLFPSKEMRDWSKFAWKKGDVLESMEGSKILFDKWASEDYTKFLGKIKVLGNSHCYDTAYYTLASKEEALEFIKSVEEINNGKLNLETLEIEKQYEFKNGDIAFADYGNRQDVFIVSGITGLSEGYSSFISIDLSSLTLSMACRISFFKRNLCELRLATEKEKQQLFDALAKDGKAWDAEKKEVIYLKPKWTPKPFDRVITKVDDDAIWTANIFSHIDQYGEYVTIGCESGYSYCLPYNEETAKLIGTTKDVED